MVISKISEEIAGRLTKKLFHEFRRTKSLILGTLSKLHELLLNPQLRTHSGTVPGNIPGHKRENQEPNEDQSQDDLYPEVGPSVYQSRHSTDSQPNEAPHRMGLLNRESFLLICPVRLLIDLKKTMKTQSFLAGFGFSGVIYWKLNSEWVFGAHEKP